MNMTDKQRGRKWVILAVCVVMTTLDLGVLFSFGAFFVAMLDKFREDRSKTASVQSLLFGVTMCFGIVSGIFVTKFGVPKVCFAGAILTPLGFIVSFFANSVIFLIVCISGISGIGISLVYISCTVAIGRVFNSSQKALALSLMQVGISVSGMTYPFFMQWLLSTYGLNGSFLILGGIYLNTFIAPILFLSDDDVNLRICKDIDNEHKPKQHDKGVNLREKCKYLWHELLELLSIILTKTFVLLLCATAITVSSINSFVVVVNDIFVWKGYAYHEGLLAFIFINISGLIGRILPGLIKQKKGVNSLAMPIIFSLFGFVGQLIMYLFMDFKLLLIGCTLTGFAVGGNITSSAILAMKMVGVERIGIGFGMITSAIGVLSSVGGPMYGRLRDGTGSYSAVFLIVAVLHIFGAFLFFVTLIVRKREDLSNKPKHPLNNIYIIDEH